MANIPDNQLVEIRRLAVLLVEVVNKAGGCVSKLRQGFIEPIDVEKIQKEITGMQVEILQIGNLADEALDTISKSKTSENHSRERDLPDRI
ncbi:MAG: hypothetical protein ABSG99_02640 [Sedimentisphaerales bacterium]